MTALTQSLVVYLSLCAVGTTAGLGLIGSARPDLRPGARLLLSPVTCLAFWAVVLGGGVALGFPVRSLAGPLWATTVALSGWGVWQLVRRRGSGSVRELDSLGIFGLTVALPVAALWPFFWYGLADYPGSIAPDGWSYVAYGQYLWDHRRFTDGGLAPLYQYAAHLSMSRHVSASLLDFLGQWTCVFVPALPRGDAQVAVGLLLAWGLYAFGSACAAVAITLGLRPLWAAGYLVLAVLSGWTANVVYLNNLDNAIALAFFPAVATLVAVVPPGSWRPAVHLGLLTSGLLYTYAELSPLVGTAAVFIAAHRILRERISFRRWSVTLGVALAVGVGLIAPHIQSLIAFLSLQSYNALTVRVGGTVMDGLVSPAHQPSAFWALGGEHRVGSNLLLRNLMGGLFSIAAAAGLWASVKQRNTALVFITGLVLAAFGVFTVGHGYGYGAYKVLIMGWWAIALLPVVGLAYLCRGASNRWATTCALGFALLAGASTSFHHGSWTTRLFAAQLGNSMQPVRAVRDIAGIVGDRGVLLAVNGAWENQWAVHFLRDLRLYVGGRRSYMAQPWVVPFMERARHVPLEDLAYALTDHQTDGGLGGAGRTPVWSAGPYRLWVLPARWAVIVDMKNPNGIESQDGSPVLWLGRETTELEVLVPRPATLDIVCTFVRGPSAPDLESFRMQVSTPTGYETQVAMAPGEGVIRVPVRAGPNQISLRALDPPTVTTTSGGDLRTLIVALTRVRVSIEGDDRGAAAGND